MNTRRFALYAFLLFALLMTALSLTRVPRAQAQDDATIIAPADTDSCLACHGEKIDATHFASSAHAKLSCQVCHVGVDRFPHPDAAIAQKPQCTTCHATKTASLAHSVHQHADPKTGKALSCQRCHGGNAHEVPAISQMTPEQQTAACVTCHRDVEKGLAGSVHAHNGKGPNGTRPTCFSCHGNNPHEINSPKASGAPSADASCRTCHVDVAKLLAGSAHGRMGAEASNRVSCLTCHGESAHTVSVKKQMNPAQKSAKCQTCHADITKALAGSAHGGDHNMAQLTCVACHGENLHAVKRAADVTVQEKDRTCKQCHAGEAKTLAASVHGHAGPDGKAAPNCLSCHWGSSHTITPAVMMDRTQQEASCKRCHGDLAASLKNSVHDRPDRQPGDHPTCLSCHGDKAHAIAKPAHLGPKERVALCSNCHSDAKHMARYGMTTGAVTSYDQSFHGRAVMRFGRNNTAVCTDCHGLHGVLSPDEPDAPTNPKHVAATCGKCHSGAKLNFALSGANHLRLRIQSSPILLLEELFFQLLIFGTMFGLLGMVVLDLRRKAFFRGSAPEAGRFVSVLIALSMACLVGGIVLAFLHVRGAEWAWLVALGLAAVALVVFLFVRKNRQQHHTGKVYRRLTLVMRIQHAILALTFTTLVLTGFPLHFADVEWMHNLVRLFGGFESARIVHRVAGVTMVLNWVWHLGYLLYLWKKADFSLKSWTMLPTKKDVRDFIDNLKYGLGLRQDPPQYDRFQFREKFDYYADMWGTIVMGSTGFILWFPTKIGNYLPDLAFGVSYIAHSYEGLLAMMAIIIWHFYNTHFNPDTFPMNPTWFTGTMTEAEMAREHPLEKERIDAAAARPADIKRPVS